MYQGGGKEDYVLCMIYIMLTEMCQGGGEEEGENGRNGSFLEN